MLTLFYAPGACSMAPHIVLEESGEKYEPRRMDLAKGEQKSPEYMKVHPMGRVPALKDVVEPAVALVLLVLALPVLAVAGALVALTSAGPVFYGDPREGRDGRPFRCWKLRSTGARRAKS